MDSGQRPIFHTLPVTHSAPSGLRQASARATAARQITRNRASYSCHACRRRKIKCDKVHPICSNCSKTGDGCTYDPSTSSRGGLNLSPQESFDDSRSGAKRRRADSKPSDSTSPSSNGWGAAEQAYEETGGPETIESRLDRLTSMVDKLSKGQALQTVMGNGGVLDGNGLRVEKRSPQAGSRRLSTSQTATWGASATPEDERSGRSTSQRRTPGRSLERPSEEFPLPPGDPDDLADPLSTLNLGYLSLQDGGRSRYVGSTYWAYVSDELGQLNQLLKNQTRYFSATTAPNEACRAHEEENGCDSDSDPGRHDYNSFHKESKRPDNEPGVGDLAMSYGKSILFRPEHGPLPSRFKTISTDMLQHVPTKRQSHVLFRCYMSGVHSLAPIIHPPAVLQFYNDFWEWYEHRAETARLCPNPAFIPLLYAIWYGGSVSLSMHGIRAEFGDESRASISARLHDEVTRCLTLISFPRNSSIPGLAAFLIVQTILAREEEPLTSSLYVGLALRVALMMGLHRDPEPFGIEPAAAETRRRIWYHIIHIDGVVALASGLPVQLCEEGYIDVKDMSEVKDTLIGTPAAKEYEDAVRKGTRPPDTPDEAGTRDGPSMVSVYYVTARGKYIMSQLIREILKIQLGTKPLVKKDMEHMKRVLNDAEAKLNAIIKRIPARGIPEMGFTPDSDASGKPRSSYDPSSERPPTEDELQPFLGISPKEGLNEQAVRYHRNTLIAFHKWARILLSLLIDKAYCVSYAPFLKNGKSKLWPLARQCALRHCHGYMRKFISLATDPAFQPFHWSWPGTHQPMHATMILLVDLYERPSSREAPRSRAFIDKMFSMAGPDGGIVSGEDGVSVQRPLREGGREAWDMLRNLREKAWQKAGLDPDILWTEEDQIQVGIANPPDEIEKHLRAYREDRIYEGDTAVGSGSDAGKPKPTTMEIFSARMKEEQEAVAATLSNPPTTTGPQVGTRTKVAPENRPPTVTSAPRISHPVFATPPAPVSANGHQQSYASSVAPVNGSTYPVSTLPYANPYFNPPTVASYSYQPSENSATTSGDPTPKAINVAVPEPSPGQTPASQPQTNAQREAGSEHHFDWEQWDAVFGQYVPIDDLMDLDPEAHWQLGQDEYDDEVE